MALILLFFAIIFALNTFSLEANISDKIIAAIILILPLILLAWWLWPKKLKLLPNPKTPFERITPLEPEKVKKPFEYQAPIIPNIKRSSKVQTSKIFATSETSATLSDYDEKLYSRTLPHGSFREFSIEYADTYGNITDRDIYIVCVSGDGIMIEAWCYLKNSMRTFRSDRILSAKHLKTSRMIKNLGRYYLTKY